MPITNTLDVSRRLTQAGVPAAQAEVFSELFEGTAQDAVREMKAILMQEGERTRTELRAEMQAQGAELRAELQAQGAELRAEMQTLRAELRAEMQAQGAELRAEMQALRNELRAEFQTELKELELRVAERLRSQMLWFFTVQTALLGIAVAVIKLFP
jgi:DNA anti-recombination protein RmuC